LLDGEQKFISSVVEECTKDPPMPCLQRKQVILQSEILPPIGLFDHSLLDEGEENDSANEINAMPRDVITPQHVSDMLDFASVVDIDELPEFDGDQMIDDDNEDIPENPDNYAIPEDGVEGLEDIGMTVSTIPVLGASNLEERELTDTNMNSDLLNYPQTHIEIPNQISEVEASLVSSIDAGGNWAGNVLSITKQLNRMRRKKADALKAIQQLKIGKKGNVTKEKKDKFRLNFSIENIRSLPPSEEVYVQMTDKELSSSRLSLVDPSSRFSSTGNPITSEWNLLPNDLYLNVDMWKTLMVSPDFSVIKPMDAKIIQQRGYNYVPVKKVQNDVTDFIEPNSLSFDHDDTPMPKNPDIFPSGFDDMPPADEPDMLRMPENDKEDSKLNIVKFEHKYAAGHDVVDHAKLKKFTLKPQPRPQDILYLKKSIRRSIACKKTDTFKQLVRDALVKISCRSRSRLNFGSCLLVLLTLANRHTLSLKREDEDSGVFGDFIVCSESEIKSKPPSK
jgi:hypothetical protein